MRDCKFSRETNKTPSVVICLLNGENVYEAQVLAETMGEGQGENLHSVKVMGEGKSEDLD